MVCKLQLVVSCVGIERERNGIGAVLQSGRSTSEWLASSAPAVVEPSGRMDAMRTGSAEIRAVRAWAMNCESTDCTSTDAFRWLISSSVLLDVVENEVVRLSEPYEADGSTLPEALFTRERWLARAFRAGMPGIFSSTAMKER